MQKIALIANIHGNLQAFKAVLNHIKSGYNPFDQTGFLKALGGSKIDLDSIAESIKSKLV